MSICVVCEKGARAVLYCRRGDCPRLTRAVVDLPRPDVTVTTTDRPDGGTDLNVRISRGDSGRSYTANQTGGGTEPIKRVVEEILADPYTAEWLPASKRG